jgi:hypothetical protein
MGHETRCVMRPQNGVGPDVGQADKLQLKMALISSLKSLNSFVNKPLKLPPRHLLAYHVLTEGRCFANIVGEAPITVEAGEVIVFTKGDPHVLSSSPGMRADPVAPDALDAAAGSQLPFFINYGGDGPPSAKVVCGYLACDAQPFNPLLDNLPPVIKSGDRRGSDAPWLGQFIRLAMIEAADKRPGKAYWPD